MNITPNLNRSCSSSPSSPSITGSDDSYETHHSTVCGSEGAVITHRSLSNLWDETFNSYINSPASFVGNYWRENSPPL